MIFIIHFISWTVVLWTAKCVILNFIDTSSTYRWNYNCTNKSEPRKFFSDFSRLNLNLRSLSQGKKADVQKFCRETSRLTVKMKSRLGCNQTWRLLNCCPKRNLRIKITEIIKSRTKMITNTAIVVHNAYDV